MLRWIVGSSLRFRYLVVAFAAAMMCYGVVQMRTMPVDVFPEFAPPLVEIQTEGPGMSTTEVEELITIQLEEALSGTPGLAILRSKSVPALSSVRLIFKPGTDPFLARQLVQERLALAIPRLPSSAGMPWMLPPLSSTSRIMKIGISSSTHDLMDLSMITYWTMRFRLMRVPGVANVAIWGERIKSLQVHVDPEQLRTYDVSLDEVMEVTSATLDVGLLKYAPNAKAQTGGFVDTPNQRFVIQHVMPVISPEELARVPVNQRKKSDGSPLLMGDLGEVVWGTWPMIGDAVINDGPGLLLIVEKFPWGNTLEVTRGVEAAIDELRGGLPGIDIDTSIFRPATFVEQAINNLTESLIVGGVLVVLVLFIFLWEWRTALISASIIPLSMMATLLVLNHSGASINVMILAGLAIAIGAIVDDAIVDVENIVRRLRQHRREGSTKSTAAIVLESSVEVRNAIVFAGLIEAAVLLPVFFLEGLTGSFFRPLAFTYVVAVLASMAVALTVTPALALILLSRAPLERREAPVTRWLQRGYEAILARIIRTPRPAYLVVGGLLLAGVAAVPFLGQSLLPPFKERDFLMHWLPKPGTSLPETFRITQQASRELRAIPGVRNFGAHIGRAIAADEVYGVYFTENWISVAPQVDYKQTVDAVQATVDGYPGLVRDVQTYLKERIKEVLTGSSEAIVIQIFGPDLDVLRGKAEEVRQAMSGIEGIVELHTEPLVDVPHVQVKVDLAKADAYGLKPGDVRRAASAMLSGIEVGDIHRDNKVYDVFVWSMPESRHSLTSIRELLIDTPPGGHVRLADVADVQILPTPNAVNREAHSRRIYVGANVRGRDLGAVSREVEARLAAIQFPHEYHYQILGEYTERQAAQQRLFLYWGASLVMVFFLLQASFGSWRLTILSFVTLPVALVGGVLAASATGGVISLGSLIGFLTVLGIVARNGIMLLNHYQHLEQEEGEPFGPGLVVRGARERLAPIVMTALTTGLALIPLVLAGDIPGHEIEHPMAIVILGGLVTSTLLNLFVVPSLYLRFAKGGPPAGAEPRGA
jgi:CzcA family heavy metal efflux pump